MFIENMIISWIIASKDNFTVKISKINLKILWVFD